jgi:hypothetical protein
LKVSEVTIKKAPIPLIIFPLDYNISFHFWIKSRFVICSVEFSDGVQVSMENIHYLFDLHHQRSLMTSADHYHYPFLKTLGRENIASFYNMERDLQVWQWFQLRFKDIAIYENRYFCPKVGFDLIVEEIYQRPCDSLPVLAKVKECKCLPDAQDFVIVMRSPFYVCTHFDISWWFSKEKFVMVLSIDQPQKVSVPQNESWKVETLLIHQNTRSVLMNKFQYHCLQHLLELDNLRKIQPLNDFNIEECYSINVFKPYFES